MTQKWSILKRRTGRSWDYESSRWPRNGRFWREERAVSSYRRFLTAKSSAEERSFWRRKMAPAKRGHFICRACHLGSGKKLLTHCLVVPRTSLDRSKIVYHLRVCFFGSYRGDVRADFFLPTLHFFLASFLRARDLVKIGRSSAKSSCAHVNFEVCFLLPSAHSKPPGHRCGMSAAETLGV